MKHLEGKGREIGKKLIERIAATCQARGVRLLLLLQDKQPDEAALAVLRHAESLGVTTLDLASKYAALVAATTPATTRRPRWTMPRTSSWPRS